MANGGASASRIKAPHRRQHEKCIFDPKLPLRIRWRTHLGFATQPTRRSSLVIRG